MLLRYEPHAHTAEVSVCARLMGAQTAEQVKNAGYDALVITDHMNPEVFAGHTAPAAYRARLHDFYFAGYRAARERGEALGLRVLPAVELRMACGPEDYLLYGLEEETLADLGYMGNLTPMQMRRVVNEAGGLVFQAHPFRKYLSCMEAACMDGVEIANANPRHDSQNAKAQAFALANGLLPIAGTDVHQMGDAGGAGIYLEDCASIVEFAQRLRNREQRCFVVENGAERFL